MFVSDQNRENMMDAVMKISPQRIEEMQKSVKSKIQKAIFAEKPSDFMDAIDWTIWENFRVESREK